MSLRWRLAIALALLAAAATTAACLTSYWSTGDRLKNEIDRSLDDTARVLVTRPDRGPLSINRFGDINRPAERGGTIADADAQARAARLGQYTVQYLDATGTQIGASGSVAIPVTARDKTVAAGGGTIHRDTTISEVDYRVATVPVQGGGAVQVARDLSETNRILASLRARYIVLGLVVSALAAAAGWVIARSATRPLVALADAAATVTETGRLDTSVGVEGKDETGRLARDFNRMLAALSGSREQQQRLVQDAGHELRTPLTSLRTNVSMLRHYERLSPDETHRMIDDVDSELRELTGLVNELVELAMDERDEEPVTDVVLARLGERAASRLYRRRSRQVVLDADDSTVAGREHAIERAITNLLDNAAKFDESGLPIELTIRDGRVSVRDHGAGIEPADLPLVFERFYRADAARSRPGSGLGLSIVRAVAESHGGTTFAENHPAGGAIVGFTLVGATTPDAGA